jgi:3-isopropylmalate/(R)-2-methylmalate dehydratase small subunit
VKAVIACSFARTFYRNAINSGLPIIECPALYEPVREDDQIEIDLAKGTIQCAGHQFTFPKFPDSVRQLLELGGLAEYLKQQSGGA